MPIELPEGLPARDACQAEGIRLLQPGERSRADAKPLDIALLNLMPEKIKPTEASLRAAEARAAKKKKAKKIKIIVSICAVVVTAVVGPPLAKWTINAVNEAGSTKKDEPTEQPAPAVGADPQATPAAGQDAIDAAIAVTSATTVPAAP